MASPIGTISPLERQLVDLTKRLEEELDLIRQNKIQLTEHHQLVTLQWISHNSRGAVVKEAVMLDFNSLTSPDEDGSIVVFHKETDGGVGVAYFMRSASIAEAYCPRELVDIMIPPVEAPEASRFAALPRVEEIIVELQKLTHDAAVR